MEMVEAAYAASSWDDFCGAGPLVGEESSSDGWFDWSRKLDKPEWRPLQNQL